MAAILTETNTSQFVDKIETKSFENVKKAQQTSTTVIYVAPPTEIGGCTYVN